MDRILHLAFMNAPISQKMVGEMLVFRDPLAYILHRVGAVYTYETIEITGDGRNLSHPERVVEILTLRHDEQLVLVTCRKDDMVPIANAIREAPLPDTLRHVVITAGNPVTQKNSDGALNLLISIGALRRTKVSSEPSSTCTIWQGEITLFGKGPRR